MADRLRNTLADSTASSSPNVQPLPTQLPTWLSLEHLAARQFNDIVDVAHLGVTIHREVTQQALAEATRLYLNTGVKDVLSFLTDEAGMSWSDIAHVIGVSVQAIRKWRLGGPVAPANRNSLAELAGFVHHLINLEIAEPASWLNMQVIAGYAPTRLDLYSAGLKEPLCAATRGLSTPEALLDQYDPQWREHLRLEHEVYVASDGLLASRRKKK